MLFWNTSRGLSRSAAAALVLLAPVVITTPAEAQRCSVDMGPGTMVPTGRVPNGEKPDAKLSAAWGVSLGIECGPRSIRFGIDVESYRLNAQDFVFGNALRITGLLARLGREFALAEEDGGPRISLAVQAGVIGALRIPGDYLLILHGGRQLAFDLDVATGGALRVVVPLASRWSILVDLAARANFLSTWDPLSTDPDGDPGLRRLVTIPVRLGMRLTL